MYYTEIFNGSRVKQVQGNIMLPDAGVPSLSGILSLSPRPRANFSAKPVLAKTSAKVTAANVVNPTAKIVFRVETKAGEVMEYAEAEWSIDGGGTQTTATRMWLLVRVLDVKGNYWTVDYDADPYAGEYTPMRINYTGNANSNPVTKPYNAVEFEYEARPDPSVAFVGGAKLSSSKRLKAIHVYYSTANDPQLKPLTDYTLNYQTSAATKRSLLQSVTETGRDVNGAASNMDPVRFTYTSPVFDNFNGPGTGGWADGYTNGPNTLHGDFNGDGRQDAMSLVGGLIWHVCLSTGSGWDCRAWVSNNLLPLLASAGEFRSQPSAVFHQTRIADLNGDGFSDFVVLYGNKTVACLSNGSSFNCSGWPGSIADVSTGGRFLSLGPNDFFIADYNGDGRQDILTAVSGSAQWQACLSTGTGFNCANWAGHGGGRDNNFLADFNGDGLTDIVGNAGSGNWHVCLSTGSSFNCGSAYWRGHGGGNDNNFIADFNGDGKSDIAGYTGGSGKWDVCLSTGIGFSCSIWSGHGGGQQNNTIGDFNGDGLSDMAGYDGNPEGRWQISFSTGTNFSNSFIMAHGGRINNNVVADFNGDGKSDLASFNSAADIWDIRLAPNVPVDQMDSVTTGLGLKTDISYVFLPQTVGDRYYREFAGLSHPNAVVTPPMSVAATLTSDNGVGGRNKTEYFYGTAVNNFDGRGFLGFEWQQVYDPATGNISRTYSHPTWNNIQAQWPYTGMARYSVGVNNSLKPGGEWQILSETVTNVAGLAVNGNQASCGGCVSGQSCIPIIDNTTQRSFELNGTELPRNYTKTQIDCWGNPVQIQVQTLDPAGNQTGYNKTTTNEYWNDPNRWWLGRLKKSTVTSNRPAN